MSRVSSKTTTLPTLAADPDNRLVKRSELASVFAVGPATIYLWEKRGLIPKARRFNSRVLRWNLAEVKAALEKAGR
jgi:predicted DNA-binding transcriptional regulator AlpA